jgi:protein-S-isoprenylcysteine O-methyltransferase Ste14
MSWRILPLVELVVFILIGAGWRSWLQARRTGSSGIHLFRNGLQQSVSEAGLLVLNGVYAAQAVALIRGTLDVAPAPWPLVGTGLTIAGTGLMVWAQLDLGASWRIGIEEGARPGLVTTRWYAVCRNPIYLFMFMAYAGLSVQLPTLLSLVLFVGLWAGVRRAVGVEEAYLERTYGEEFRAYAHRVGRFVPGIGRLADSPAAATTTVRS